MRRIQGLGLGTARTVRGEQMDTGRHLERPTADCLLADRISGPGCSNPGTLLQNRASLRDARDAPRGAAVGWRAASGLARRPAWRPRWLARNTGGQLLVLYLTPSLGSTGNPAAFQAVQPPVSALAFLHPARRSSRATRALVASSCHAQYRTSVACWSSRRSRASLTASSGGMRIAPTPMAGSSR